MDQEDAAHQAVNPFSSRFSGCSHKSCTFHDSCATKLRSDALDGTSTGRLCAMRRAVELCGHSESHAEKPVGSRISNRDLSGRTVRSGGR